MSRILSSEIVSLVHHVKLNESGWWEKSIQNIIISFFGSNGNAPKTDEDVISYLKNELSSDLENSRILKQLDILKSKKKLVKVTDILFLLSQEEYEAFKISFENQKSIESETQKRFNELCYIHCPDINKNNLWRDLNEELIIPLIREIGAKTYILLSGEDSKSISEYGQFNSFILKFDGEKDKIQNLLLNFFDFKNQYVKSYILHLLNAYFFIEASNLNQHTVQQVYLFSKTQTNLKIFVDTNFLLTLLDLHDNPSNDAALSFMELLKEIDKKVKVKFYVLPKTVLEFKNLISKFKDYLKRMRPTLSQAIAAENSDEFSGILKKYFQKCHEKKTVLDIDDYFDPYIENFTVNIRTKGIDIQQDNMDKYSTDQRVVDDLLEQVDYRYERSLNAGKFKNLDESGVELRKRNIYDKFNHDCQIWYYVKDKRPTYIDSVKDINTWILTLDFSFLEFDRFKQLKDNQNIISICLHPNEFISMLQFWVPRSEKLENAILGNFRLPFLFKEIDNESEKVSIEILRAMSQYEDKEKFTTELVTEILTNKALRQKIKVDNNVEENAALIKDELLKKYEAAQELLNQEQEENKNLNDKLASVENEIGILNQKIDELKELAIQKIENEFSLARKTKIKEIENTKSNLLTRKKTIESRISDFQDLIQKAELEVEKSLGNFSNQFKSFFLGKETVKSKLLEDAHTRYYNKDKYGQLLKENIEIEDELKRLEIPIINEKTIIYCENQNSIFFNKLGFKNIHFVSEKDSNSVFIKMKANSTHFGLRDRDYLTDGEIKKLTKDYPNYMILGYYCFENYLYHPENIEEVLGTNFDKEVYIGELIKQKKEKYDSIVLKLTNARRGYQEFKLPDTKFREDESIICDYLKSDAVEVFLKSFSLKTEFNKNSLSKYQLTAEVLSSTNWFRKKIESVLSIQNDISSQTEVF